MRAEPADTARLRAIPGRLPLIRLWSGPQTPSPKGEGFSGRVGFGQWQGSLPQSLRRQPPRRGGRGPCLPLRDRLPRYGGGGACARGGAVPRSGGGREPCHNPKYFGQPYSSLPHRLRAVPPRRGGQGVNAPFSTVCATAVAYFCLLFYTPGVRHRKWQNEKGF